MNVRVMPVIGTLVLFSLAHAGDQKTEGRYRAAPLKGDYYMYGGTMADMVPPTASDRKVSLMLNGQLAKDLFSQIGPDIKPGCSTMTGYHERRRGDLACVLDQGEYSCYLGLDVIKGKTIHGLIC